MKTSLKKAVSLMLVFVMCLTIGVPAFAESNANDVKDSGVKDSGIISYISESDAILLANQCINDQIGDDDCPWKKSTKISDTADLFDFEGNVNAYLFRLTTGGKRSGYVFVNAYVNTPSVEAFGYDCDFMLDSMLKKNHKPKAATDDHIIFAGGLAFLTQNKSGEYFVIGDKTRKLSKSKFALAENYRNNLPQKVDSNSQLNLQKLKTNTIEPMKQIIYDQNDLNGIWYTGYTIYITTDFHEVNNCAPTAATNLVYYWAHYGTPEEPNLWTGRVYGDLENDMDYKFDEGTSNDKILPGIEKFAKSRNTEIAGSSDDGTDWDTLENRIDDNYPIIVTISSDPNYGSHAMLGVGYQDTSDGNYIRVADGEVRTFSNFYKQSNYMYSNYCVWW